MPKQKVLSGNDVIEILEKFGFRIVSQKGSHVKLRRIINNCKQTMTIPRHHELDRGTVRAIYKQALRYINEFELENFFINK